MIMKYQLRDIAQTVEGLRTDTDDKMPTLLIEMNGLDIRMFIPAYSWNTSWYHISEEHKMIAQVYGFLKTKQ